MLSLRGNSSAATMLAGAVIAAVCLAVIIFYPDNPLLYNFLSLPIILAGLLLPIGSASAVSALVIAGTALLVVLRNHGLAPPGSMAAVGELSVLAVLILSVSHRRDRTEHSRRRSLAQSEQNLRALADNASNGILVSFHTRHVFANRMAARMLGYTVEELLRTEIRDIVHPKALEQVSDHQRRRIAGEDIPNHYETLLITKDGRPLPVALNASRTTWMGRDASMAFFRDISAAKRAEAQMHKLSSTVEQAADAVMITDREGVIEYINPAFTAMTGYAREEAVGFKPSLKKSGKQSEAFYRKLWETILSGDVFNDVFINRRRDGTLYYEEQTITPLRDQEGYITHFVSTGRDISERMAIQERLQYMAHHDVLTELPNRTLFMDRLKQALARARWHKRVVAVMFLDLDRFKQINDSLGHEVGDRLLGEFSRRIESNLRDGDTVARFGGDEFVILLNDIRDPQDIADIAEKTLGIANDAFHINGHELSVSASIGISLFPYDGEESDMLMRNADTAMYRAKETGKNNFQFYSREMSDKAFHRLSLENALRHALEREEFALHYQPVIDIETGRMIGAEALLRWENPEFGPVPTGEFIHLLEDTGLIIPVSQWVMNTACAQAAAWVHARPDLHISVNLSRRQLASKSVLTMVQDALHNSGLSPRLLILEITESFLMHNIDSAVDILNSFAEQGIGLAIDDFGIGYSSLSSLKRLPLHILKVDQSFVRELITDPDDASIVRTILAMAANLKLDVIAEGVETAEQLAALRSFGCRNVQGFYYSRPLPHDQIEPLLIKDFSHAPATRPSPRPSKEEPSCASKL